MSDDIVRKTAANWREHLSATCETVRVLRWVWRELTMPVARRAAKRMLAYSVLTMTFAMVGPWLISRVIDATTRHNFSGVIWSAAGVAGAWLMTRLFSWRQSLQRELVQGESTITMDTRLSALFFSKSLGQHLAEGSLLTASNVEKGRAKATELQDMLLYFGLNVVLQVLVTFVFIWIFSPVMGAVMTTLLLWYLITGIFLNYRCEIACTPLDARFRAVNRRRCERWDKVERVKTSNRDGDEVTELHREITGVIADDRKFWFWFIHAITIRGLPEVIAGVGIMIFGVVQVWQGDWTVGLLYPAIVWSRQMSDSLWGLGQIESRLNWAMPSVKSMMDALTLEPDIRDKPDASPLSATGPLRITFENVSHWYVAPQSDGQTAALPQPVLNEVSFSIEPGEKVAFIGASGVGKTTIARLLQRYADPAHGAVTVGGHDLRDVRLRDWLAQTAYIPQQPQVFDGTIRSNLVYALPPERQAHVTDEDLWALMRQLRIDFGKRLTDGLDTKVGRNGLRLSGGEAQRLMIAAAVLRDPRFIIIDEATASLDSTNEKLVQQGLAEALRRDVSAIVIAHRLSTVRHLCDKFVVMTGVGEGHGARIEAVAKSFEELYRLSPTFRQLADDQDLRIDRADLT